ncbi:MAG: nickel pincer cofactor biosynthesis protein LarB [Nitrospirae bacterium]|nr:nickel pincer cofactor biosynthesis protein LarB [Nitrospirota bacterium]
MDEAFLKSLLAGVREGKTTINKAIETLKHLPFENIQAASVDHHRHLRQGVPEVVFAKDKTPEETSHIARAMLERSGRCLVTRASKAHHAELISIPGAKVEYSDERAGTIAVSNGGKRAAPKGNILILTAGTSDIPVAGEAAVTARFLGSRVTTAFDVGVAGIHRLFDKREMISGSRVIIVVAGMEGALPSVVGGLTDRPVIAVPTSTGYGTSLGGLTALFAMLNSCVPGIAVMNIDNGFGAACLAHKINVGRTTT